MKLITLLIAASCLQGSAAVSLRTLGSTLGSGSSSHDRSGSADRASSAQNPLLDAASEGVPTLQALGVNPQKGVGRYPIKQAAITLAAFAAMLGGQIPALAKITDVSAAYEFIGVPPGQAFAIWGIIFTFEAIYVILSFIWRGNAESGAQGHPNDLASLNWKLQNPIRGVFVMQGIWSLLYGFVKTDYTVTNSGKSGIARGNALNEFDFFFWTSSILLFVIAGTFYHIAYQTSLAAAKNEPSKGSREIFFAMTGLLLNTGWITAAASFIPNQIALSLTTDSDDGNLAMQNTAIATAIGASLVALAPMVSCRTKKYNFWPMWAALTWAFSWVSSRVHKHENEANFGQMIHNEYTTSKGIDVDTFINLYFAFAVTVASTCGLFILVGLSTAPRNLLQSKAQSTIL